MKFSRQSGVLLHITSLPSKFGIGDLGPDAYKFVDWLQESKQRLWQVLPFSMTDELGCPYSGVSAFSGNPLMISPEKLIEDGFLSKKDISEKELRNISNGTEVDFKKITCLKNSILNKAFHNLKKCDQLKSRLEQFINENKTWINDFAFFMVASNHLGNNWTKWPMPIKERNLFAMHVFGTKYATEIEYQKFLQFIFFDQWNNLKQYANQKNVKIIGDVPIFVGHHSMDIWKDPQWFKLDVDGNYNIEVGAAPDMFSVTGQKWGHPNYNWHIMQFDGFSWWCDRVEFMLKHFDIIRLDHFRGFQATWEIHSDAYDATSGWWANTPGHQLFETLYHKLGALPLIVEDLGKITDDVRHLRDRFELPGMAVLQLAFANGEIDPNLPHNIGENSVIYPATHDNNTTKGYFDNLPYSLEKQFAAAYLQINTFDWINWDMMRLAMYSRANTSIVSLQDIMGIGSEGRFNTPGTETGNWNWRFNWNQLKQKDQEVFRNITIDSGRDN